MAHLDTEAFSCPICQDLLKDPVSLTCGHNYCLSCITDRVDRGDENGIHSCPQCREEFIPRPQLLKNTTLAAVVEQLKETEVKAAPADDCYAGVEEVACDVCTAQLQQLPLTEDDCRFLQHDSSAWPPAASTGSSGSSSIRPDRRFGDVTAAVSERSQNIQQLLRDTWTNISPTEVEVELSLAAQPTTREEFLRYSADLTLDPNTAHTRMVLSEGNTRATYTLQIQHRPHHPDRFTGFWYQVLSTESLTGRYYWEVRVRQEPVVVAAAYKNISRTGDESGFGCNVKSWALESANQRYRFSFNGVRSEVSGPWSDTVGVYLDHAAGLLSFYSVSHSMTLLHRVHTTFTQPLHAGLELYWDSSCELVKLG